MADTKIMACKCESEFQDKRYGNGLRVHNKCGSAAKSKNQSSTITWRCTICGATRS